MKKEIIDLINNKSQFTDEDFSKIYKEVPWIRKQTSGLIKRNIGKNQFYICKLDWYNYKADLIDQIYFETRDEAKKFEEGLIDALKYEGITRPIHKYDEQVARDHGTFIKIGITSKGDVNGRYSDVRYKETWEIKPGIGECYPLRDKETILKLYEQIKNKQWIHPFEAYT